MADYFEEARQADTTLTATTTETTTETSAPAAASTEGSTLMAYPPGVSLATITIGAGRTMFGAAPKLISATVTPIFKGTPHVVHAASGWAFYPTPRTFRVEDGAELTFELPHVDAEGWRDTAGNEFPALLDSGERDRGWAYHAKFTIVGGSGQDAVPHRYEKIFQPLVGQTEPLDIDLVPDGQIGVPVSAPVANVSSIAGLTGVVTEEQLQDLGLGGASDPEIAALLQDEGTFTGSAIAANYASQFTATGSTTAAEINAWLAAGSALGVKRLSGTATIGAPGIIVPDGVTLDATGAVINEAPNTHGNLLTNAAVAPLRTGTADAATTAGSGTVTVVSAGAGFSTADVGRALSVNHLEAGKGENTYGTITAVDTATNTATVRGVTRATEAGGIVKVFGRNRGITIIGGTWNRGANSGSGASLHTVRLRRVDSLTVRDMTITSEAGKYALSLGDVTDYTVKTIQFNSASDGLHVQGPAYRGRVDDLRGYTHDDLLGITASDYQHYNDVFGDIDGLTVTGLHQNGGLAALKIIGGTGCKVRGVSTTGIYGTSLIRPVAIGSDIAGPSDLDGLVVRDVYCMPPASTEPLVRLWAAAAGEPVKIGSLILENFKYHGQAGQVIRLDGSETVTVDHLVARNFRLTGGSLTGLMMVQGNARLGNVEVDGLRVESTGASNATYCMYSFAGAVIDRFTVRNSTVLASAPGGKFIGGLGNLKTLNLHGLTTTQQDVVRTDQTTAMTVNMSDIKASHATGGRLVRFQGPVKLNLSGDIVADFQAEPFQMAGASASLDVTGAFAPMNGRGTAVRDLTQTITSRDIRFHVRADWLAKVTGSMAYNTVAQASGALPVGPVHYDGTAWVHMVTGGSWTPA